MNESTARSAGPRLPSRKLVICGANGNLAHALISECKKRNLPYVALSRPELDASDSAAVQNLCDEIRPWALINATGYVRIDQAANNCAQCTRDNVDAPRILAAAAQRMRIPFVTFSSDLVFDGRVQVPYAESSLPAPLSVYGQSKLAGEIASLRYENTLCIRTAAFFGASSGRDVLAVGLTALRRGAPYSAIDDLIMSPTYLPDLAIATLDLMIDGCAGLVHLANKGAISWAGLLELAAQASNVSTRTLQRRPHSAMNLRAQRPAYSAMISERIYSMPTLEDALVRYSGSYSVSSQDGMDNYDAA